MNEDSLDEEEVKLIKDQETIEKISQKIFPILQTKDETNIISEFYNKEYKNIDLTLCINNSYYNNTILTTLVNYNLTRATSNFLTTIKSYKKSSEEFLSYINKKNTKGYNALLYSSFRGNLEIFSKLMENGADISAINSSGLNALHLAAQGNFPNIIIFLIEKYKIDINSKDNKGNSALHWAVYSNSRQAVDYLIYYKIDINLKDNDNDTALQIAIRKGNNYLVKKLRDDFSILYDKNIEEINNKENENELNNNQNIQNNGILIELLNRFLGANSKNTLAFPFLLIMIILEGINQIIILYGYKNLFMGLVFFILFSMLLFFYFTSSKSDPGQVTNSCINSLILLAEQGEDMKNICPWCINYIDEKTHHCFLCKKCIKFQEFHDIYINNCVGRNNYSLYMSFLYFFAINSCFKLIICLWGLFWLKNLKKVILYIIPQILAVSACIAFIVLKIRAKSKIFNGWNFGSFFMGDIKDNIDNNNNIDNKNNNNNDNNNENNNQTNSSRNNLNNILPSLVESDKYI